jgi:hypothetical protein
MAMRDGDESWRSTYDGWKTTPPPQDSVTSAEEDDARERRWNEFASECCDFAKAEKDGWPAVLRAVAEAMKGQAGLFRG